MDKRCYETVQYQMDKGAKGRAGPLSERLDRMAPVTVMDKGVITDQLCKMFEFHPDIGDLHGRAAKAIDVHKNWEEWFVGNGYSWKHFTGVTCQAMCGNDIDGKGTVRQQEETWINSLERDAPWRLLSLPKFVRVGESSWD